VKFLAVLGFVFWKVAALPEPFVPKSDPQILERVRTASADPLGRELRRWRAALAEQPRNVPLAVRIAEQCLERARAEGDPRYLGYAQAALAPWWEAEQAPLEVQVLRATLRQTQHDFINALVDLDGAIKTDPNCAQAWLSRATILAVLGRYDDARQACVPLLRLAPRLAAVTALANVAGLHGEGEKSQQLLCATLERNPVGSPSEKTWALTVLAELDARLGHAAAAERHFREAFALGQRDVYLLGAFADYVLDHNRPSEVITLLKNETRIDGLLLRLALAEAALERPPASLQAHVAALQARFDASRMRGDGVHRREQARYELHLRRQPIEALRLAQANWQVQREPADARILIESAIAANNVAGARPVLDFVRTNRVQDVHLRRLVAQANRKTPPL
jgi:tetratricopeptide (TPR) repeat protein